MNIGGVEQTPWFRGLSTVDPLLLVRLHGGADDAAAVVRGSTQNPPFEQPQAFVAAIRDEALPAARARY